MSPVALLADSSQIWSASLTVGSQGTAEAGYRNDDTETQFGSLSDTEFAHGEIRYEVHGVRRGDQRFVFDTDPIVADGLKSGASLVVDDRVLPLGDASADSGLIHWTGASASSVFPLLSTDATVVAVFLLMAPLAPANLGAEPGDGSVVLS